MTNRHLLTLSLALLAAFGASAAMAQEEEGTPLTRAQVLAELHAAQAAGEVPHGDLDISAHNGGADDSPARPPLRVVPKHAKVATDLHQDKKAQM
jgi:hypothetical protein